MSADLGAESLEKKLPVHGFVLAGGSSSRMGVDKATLEFRGRPMVEIAVEKLRAFCADVSICGNREDLAAYAPIVHEARRDAGPAAGIEAGLLAAKQEWCLFVPVDVPLVPGELLRRWAEEVLLRTSHCSTSYLGGEMHRSPVFCMVKVDSLASISRALDGGERRVEEVLWSVENDGDAGVMYVQYIENLVEWHERDTSEVEQWFSNLNTPLEFEKTERTVSRGEGSTQDNEH